MKVDFVYFWIPGEEIQKKYAKFVGDGPFEVSPEDLESLVGDYDVAFMHFRQQQPTKKQRLAGAAEVPDKVALCLDQRAGKFRQR
jgi:hypothetical protein